LTVSLPGPAYPERGKMQKRAVAGKKKSVRARPKAKVTLKSALLQNLGVVLLWLVKKEAAMPARAELMLQLRATLRRGESSLAGYSTYG
jgi:hypothetical protein